MCECEWIETAIEALKDHRKYLTLKQKPQDEPEPILIIHGLPEEIQSSKNVDSILKIIKSIAIEGYQELLKNQQPAVDIVALTISQLEEVFLSQQTSVRNSILMDNVGRVGCVSALTAFDHPILLARRLTHEHGDVIIVQENMEGRRISDLTNFEHSDDLSGSSNSWGVIVRDSKGNLAGGRSLWVFSDDPNTPSLSAAATVPGCGLFVDEKSCCSVSGDNQAIYIHAPARKILQRLQEKHLSSVELKEKIEKIMGQDPEALIAVVLLGTNDKPLIIFKSEYFPWAYCHRGILNYGCREEEVLEEKIILDMPLDCQCNRKNHLREK